MSAAERFIEKAEKGAAISFFSQRERDLQGVCHELLEIIEGQEYIIEDAQFTINYAAKLDGGYQNTVGGMIPKMEEVKDTAQNLYDNVFNCKRARERAGLESTR